MPRARKTRALWLRPTAKVYPLANAASFRSPETWTLVPNSKYKREVQSIASWRFLDTGPMAFTGCFVATCTVQLEIWHHKRSTIVLLALGQFLTILVLLHPLVSWVSLETGLWFWRRPAQRQVSISVTAWGSCRGQGLPVLFTLGGSESLAVCAWRHIFGCWRLLANLVFLSCPAIKEAAVGLCVGTMVPCSEEGWACTAPGTGLSHFSQMALGSWGRSNLNHHSYFPSEYKGRAHSPHTAQSQSISQLKWHWAPGCAWTCTILCAGPGSFHLCLLGCRRAKEHLCKLQSHPPPSSKAWAHQPGREGQ